MNTNQLIETLTSNVMPVRRGALRVRLALGMVIGALVSAALVITMLGARHDLTSAMHGFSFWMKWSYTLSLSAIAIYATARLRGQIQAICGRFGLSRFL